jgi:hypothetical protein
LENAPLLGHFLFFKPKLQQQKEANMPKGLKMRKLVVLKPSEGHKKGYGLSHQERLLTRLELLRIKPHLDNKKCIIFSQNTRCAAETSILAQAVFGIDNMFMFAEVLATNEPHQPQPKHPEKMLEFLRAQQAGFDVLIIVTHIRDTYDEQVFLAAKLEGLLNWRIPAISYIGDHRIIDYQVVD